VGRSRPARATRAHTAPPVAPANGSPRRARRLLVPAVAAGLAILALSLWLRPGHAAPEIPDPVTPDMLAPVRQVLEEARRAVLSAPESARAWGELGEVCDAHHLYPEAEVCYREAHVLEPREFRWVYGLAVVRDFEGAEAAEVAALFDEAIRLQPRFPPARLRAGDALVRQGLLEEARAAYAEAVALDPEFAMAHRNLGQTLLALDDVDGALEHLERAAALDPGDGVTAGSLTQAYWRAGNAARAEESAAEARSKAPVFGVPDPVRYAIDQKNVTPLASDRRAKENEESGNWAAALPDLERLVAMKPEDPGERWRLARTLLRTGSLERARTELENVLAAHPEHVPSLALLATIHEQTGELVEAAPLYRRLCTLVPGNAGYWTRLGSCLGPLGDLSGALEAFQQAAACGTPGAELLHNWGTTLARAGHPSEACERLRAALELEPDNAGTHYNLADALEALGRVEEAVQHFERARTLDPGLPVAERLLALRGK